MTSKLLSPTTLLAEKEEMDISLAEIQSPATLLNEVNSQHSDEKNVSKRKFDESGISGNINEHYNYTPG